jgi:hypothetical protein
MDEPDGFFKIIVDKSFKSGHAGGFKLNGVAGNGPDIGTCHGLQM